MIMAGTHDARLVVLSILIAIFASFTALDIAARIRATESRMHRVWVSAAAVALGGGIWAMHFVAMLAFSVPGMRMGYDLGLTLLSLALAVLFTGAGFAIMGWRWSFQFRALAAGILMGFGVAAMHYVGMAAMRMPGTVRYDPVWVVASVLIALAAATAAVGLASRDQKMSQRLVAATLMGFAIAGMHYAGMRGAIFVASEHADMPGGLATLDQSYLAVAISGITALILALALGAARLERVLAGIARREERTALRLKVADILRGGGTQEAMNEVAALMGRHFAVSRTGYGQLDPIEDVFSYDVCWTNGRVPPLLGRFPAAAFGVKIVAELSAGKTVVVEDLLTAELSSEAETRETARSVDTRSILVVPFVREGRLRTIVYLNDQVPREWQANDIAFMEELAERTRLVIERDTVEAKLRELNATLEARVEARTAELHDAQSALLQSQKMEAVGQLVAGLAHDFNNLLGAVVGSFELIGRRSGEPERVRRFAEAGLQAARRGSKLTAQLLAFSRSQSIQLQPIFIRDLIEDLHDLLTRTLGPAITLDLKDNTVSVAALADPTQVEMMILNLAINARDAMPAGGTLAIATAVRTVTADAELADGDYVEISVRDTGIGMDEATVHRATEPFFTTKPKGKGTGLGLAQIYGSARQSGGAVRLESAPGAGTTVRVLLPCTKRLPAGAESVDFAPIAVDGLPRDLLIVDDDNDHRGILVKGLESLGLRVTEAVDGLAALAALEAKLPELVLLDFAMPGINGAEVARKVRQRWPSLPIVFISGFADTQAIKAAVGEQASILHKPFRMAELLQAIREEAAKHAIAERMV